MARRIILIVSFLFFAVGLGLICLSDRITGTGLKGRVDTNADLRKTFGAAKAASVYTSLGYALASLGVFGIIAGLFIKWE